MIVFTVGITLTEELKEEIQQKVGLIIDQEVYLETDTKEERLNEQLNHFVKPGGVYALVTHNQESHPRILMILAREITFRSQERVACITAYGGWDRSLGRFVYHLSKIY